MTNHRNILTVHHHDQDANVIKYVELRSLYIVIFSFPGCCRLMTSASVDSNASHPLGFSATDHSKFSRNRPATGGRGLHRQKIMALNVAPSPASTVAQLPQQAYGSALFRCVSEYFTRWGTCPGDDATWPSEIRFRKSGGLQGQMRSFCGTIHTGHAWQNHTAAREDMLHTGVMKWMPGSCLPR